LFTTTLFDDDIMYGTTAELDFLKKLDVIIEQRPGLVAYIHRNLPCTGGICYAYENSETNEYKHSYPDYIIKTKKGLTIICELKLSWDIDSNKTESIKIGFRKNSRFTELNKYFLGIIHDNNKKFKMSYCHRGKKLAEDFDFLQDYQKSMCNYTDLSILFDCISLIEKNMN
jgi:hypothetical protein